MSHIDRITIKDLGCSKHCLDISKLFKEYIIIHGINAFCKNINDFLSGKITKLPSKSNSIQELAQIFRAKKKRVVKHSDIFAIGNQKEALKKATTRKVTTKKASAKKATTKKATSKKVAKKQTIK